MHAYIYDVSLYPKLSVILPGAREIRKDAGFFICAAYNTAKGLNLEEATPSEERKPKCRKRKSRPERLGIST